GRYQIRRHWLTGERAGQTEMFMENLPGFPNGISRRADGSFWLGFSTRRNAAMDSIHPHPWLKKLVFSLPMWLQPEQERYGVILNISATGEVIDTYFDPTGDRVPETSSVTEYDGTLLIGGDMTQQIAQYRFE
ncbi:MAG: SMP-30/gluconolactonase/LRE family protein, partial [Deinococcota bacterium]